MWLQPWGGIITFAFLNYQYNSKIIFFQPATLFKHRIQQAPAKINEPYTKRLMDNPARRVRNPLGAGLRFMIIGPLVCMILACHYHAKDLKGKSIPAKNHPPVVSPGPAAVSEKAQTDIAKPETIKKIRLRSRIRGRGFQSRSRSFPRQRGCCRD